MARIAGVDLPNHKRIDIALTYLYGIGRSNVKQLIKLVAIDGTTKVGDLTEENIGQLQKTLEEKFTTEGDLRGEIAGNIKRLREIGCYRGIRHVRGLPSRGQRTRSNARTKRGKRKTVGALRKEVRAKLETGTKAAETK
jgi:small subunit ribosomal protein S13